MFSCVIEITLPAAPSNENSFPISNDMSVVVTEVDDSSLLPKDIAQPA